jgi:hypothetical protein
VQVYRDHPIALPVKDQFALHTSLALRHAIWRKEVARWVVCGIPMFSIYNYADLSIL